MQKWIYKYGLLLLLLLFIGVVYAQETEVEELAIPYYQSADFNVPLLEEWEDTTENNSIDFNHTDWASHIRVVLIDENDATQGIQQALSNVTTETLPEPLFQSRVNLADGTWHQFIYGLDNGQTISAFGQARDGQTYVLSFSEQIEDDSLYMLIVQNQELPPTLTAEQAVETAQDEAIRDARPGIQEAVETLFGEEYEHDPSQTTFVELPSGTWQRNQYELPNGNTITALGMVFGNATYVTLQQGETADIAELSDAFNTVFLGFFVTVDTITYLYLGLAVVFGLFIFLIGSIFLRYRNLQKDVVVIQQLASEG